MSKLPSYVKLLSILLLVASLSGCAEHAKMTGFFHWTPDPGYQFTNPADWSLTTHWRSGIPYPGRPFVLAAATEGLWQPKPGYAWNDASSDDQKVLTLPRNGAEPLDVSWRQGLSRPDFPHTVSYKDEGYWVPVKGYQFVKTGELATEWNPGEKDPDKDHLVAGLNEGTWVLEPGYASAPSIFGGTYVSWSPGTVNSFHPCLKAAPQERQWQPIDGYHLGKNSSGDLIIVQDEQHTDWGKVLVDFGIFLVADGASKPQQDDGVAASVGRPIAGVVSDAAIHAAAQEFTHPAPGACDGLTLASMGMR